MYIGLRYTGWLGAAYGTVVSAILSFLIMYSVLNKTIGVKSGKRSICRVPSEIYHTVEILGALSENKSLPTPITPI